MTTMAGRANTLASMAAATEPGEDRGSVAVVSREALSPRMLVYRRRRNPAGTDVENGAPGRREHN